MKPWSKTIDRCSACKSTAHRHMAKGLCIYCYLKQYHNDPKNVKKVKEQKNKHYIKKQKPKAQEAREERYFDGMRQTVLERDENLCQHCFSPGDIVHHKDGNGRGSGHPNNSLENLITLCRACHLKEHREHVVAARFKPGVDGWSKKFDKCIICGKADSEHNSKGRCARCIAKLRRSKVKI